jgi:hypothetical protein
MLQFACTHRKGGEEDMAVKPVTKKTRMVRRKNYRIDVTKLERTRKILGTRTETETIHRALDLVADEAALVEALQRFVEKGRGRIEDIDARS